jgi:hypothetical protein
LQQDIPRNKNIEEVKRKKGERYEEGNLCNEEEI